MGLAAALTVAITIGYLKDGNSSALVYQQKIEKVFELEEAALKPFREGNEDNNVMLENLEKISRKKWQQAQDIMEETQEYDLDENTARHRELLTEYVELRNKHTALAIRSLKGDENVNSELQEVTDQIESTLDKLKEQ